MNKFALALTMQEINQEKKVLIEQNKQIESYLYGEKCILSEIDNKKVEELIDINRDINNDLKELTDMYKDMEAFEDVKKWRIMGKHIECKTLKKESREKKLQYIEKKHHKQKKSLNKAVYSIITALCPTMVGAAMSKLTNDDMNCGIGKIIMLIRIPIILLAIVAALPVHAVIASAAYVIYFTLSIGIGSITAEIIETHKENKSIHAFRKLIEQEIQQHNYYKVLEDIRRQNLSEIIDGYEKIYNSKLERQNLQKKEQEAKKSSSKYSQKIINMLNEMRNSLVVNENAYSKKIVR